MNPINSFVFPVQQVDNPVMKYQEFRKEVKPVADLLGLTEKDIAKMYTELTGIRLEKVSGRLLIN